MEGFIQISQTLLTAAVLIALGVKIAWDMKQMRKEDLIPVRPGRVAVSVGLVLFGLYYCYQSVVLYFLNGL